MIRPVNNPAPEATMRDVRIRMRRRTPRVAVLAASLALAGCMLGPNYHRADLNLPDRYDASGVAAVDAAGVAVRNDWWKLYNDPQLTALVEASLANNPSVRLAIARVDEARGALKQANSAFFPEIDYSGFGARARNGAAGGAIGGSSVTGTGAPVIGDVFSLSASVSYEVDLWGKIRRASEAARAQLLGTTYARDVVTLSLSSTTAESYFTLRALDAQIKVTENTLGAVGESLDIARKRLEAGYTSALDYQQAETLRAQTQVNLRDLRRQRAIQEHQLANLTSNLTLKIAPGSIDDLPVPSAPPPGMPSTLLERRPDVARDEQAVVTANAEIGVARAAMFPTFAITGAYGGQSFDLSDLLKMPFRFWNIGLGISGPIFAGGKYVAQVDQAKARNNEQIATYQTTVEGAFREVADALTNVAEYNAAEPEVMTQVEAARRTLYLSKLRYQQGYSAYLDVLDATRQANLAEITLVQNRAARLSSSVDLFRALGGGWSDAAVTQTSTSPLGKADGPSSGMSATMASTSAR
jgi:multidrug efflux system outer membrane protein